MSRATFTSVFSVAAVSVVASSAQASAMPSPVVLATATAGTAVAAPFRKTRRSYLLRRSTSLMGFLRCMLCWLLFEFIVGGSSEAAAFLDHLDLVAVGIGSEEEARQRLAVVLEVAQRSRRQLLAPEARVFGIDVVDHDGEMAVAVAERVRLLAIEIDGELDLEG